MDLPIIVYFEEAQARLNDKPVEIPTLHATAIILVTQGASKIYVPAFEHKDQIVEAIERLPPLLKGRISLVDSRASLLRRVFSFVEPLRNQVERLDEMSGESVFVRELIPFLYQVALGVKYAAGTTDGYIDDITHDLHSIKPGVFKGEARARLALLANLITSYRPFVSAHAGVRGYAGNPGIRGKFLDVIETAEFNDVVEKSGYLGLIRRPRVALEKLRRSVTSLVSRPGFRSAAKAAEAISTLAGHPMPADPILSIAEKSNKGRAFSPPMLDLYPFRHDIYAATLAEFDKACKPPPGSLYQIHVHQPGICGNMWADSHTRVEEYDAGKHYKALWNCHLTAKETITELIKTEDGSSR